MYTPQSSPVSIRKVSYAFIPSSVLGYPGEGRISLQSPFWPRAYVLPFATDFIITVSTVPPVELYSITLSPALSENGAYRPPSRSSPAHQTTMRPPASILVPCGKTNFTPPAMSSLNPQPDISTASEEVLYSSIQSKYSPFPSGTEPLLLSIISLILTGDSARGFSFPLSET